MTANIKKILSLALLVTYTYLAIISLFNISTHNHSDDLPCPYSIGSHSICEMDPFSHLNNWRKISLVSLSLVFVYLTAISYFYIKYKNNFDQNFYWRQMYVKSSKLLRKLSWERLSLSNGILNPKPY